MDFVEINSHKRIALNLEEIRIEEIIKHVLELYQGALEHKPIDLSYELVHQIPNNFLSDKLRITQVLIQLVGNSAKFTFKGFIKILVKMDSHGQI